MIKAQNLIKDFGAFRAVDRATFEVRQGDILGFLGPNGAGKSTTMKMITGFLPPSGGAASIGGHDILDRPIEAKRLLGYLPENGPLYQEMTVLEFLGFAAEIRGFFGESKKKAIDRVLQICHLEGVRDQPIETLSKGFRQRVGLAQAVIHDPAYLVMDEPTDGLDPNQKQEVRKLIASMAKDKAIILSTHILEEVEAMCNRVIIINRGRIIVDETPNDLLKRHPRCNAVRLSVSNANAADLREAIGRIREVAKMENISGGLLVYPRDGQAIKPLLWNAARANNWQVATLENAQVRLDEVFRELTRNDQAEGRRLRKTECEETPGRKGENKHDDRKEEKLSAGSV